MTKWITVKTFAPHVEMTKDQIYRLIREAEASPEKREEIFPFRFVRLGRQIRIDAASAGIFSESQNSKAQAQDEELKATSGEIGPTSFSGCHAAAIERPKDVGCIDGIAS